MRHPGRRPADRKGDRPPEAHAEESQASRMARARRLRAQNKKTDRKGERPPGPRT
ncbi:hypothetical protein GCM10011371_01930 [Novosphingobium marinum]|uniref:Uncharacterized protein n=1 Tax=Novosphingobium marinum TaxID=1514948 RepID=A0A7Y9XUZ9_9SPHN|nr:hypothetical protein [Novosphingobium marinum]GGC18004.1 hypothetical protein GCM10011371_01930 [Novosphingobium marinum]